MTRNERSPWRVLSCVLAAMVLMSTSACRRPPKAPKATPPRTLQEWTKNVVDRTGWKLLHAEEDSLFRFGVFDDGTGRLAVGYWPRGPARVLGTHYSIADERNKSVWDGSQAGEKRHEEFDHLWNNVGPLFATGSLCPIQPGYVGEINVEFGIDYGPKAANSKEFEAKVQWGERAKGE